MIINKVFTANLIKLEPFHTYFLMIGIVGVKFMLKSNALYVLVVYIPAI